MAGKNLTANVIVLDEAENPVLLEAGRPVPAEYADQVGDHCFVQGDGSEPAKKSAPKKS